MESASKQAVPSWYKEAQKLLRDESNLDEQSANAILHLVTLAQQSTLAQERRSTQEKRVKAAQRLLKNYHLLRASVRSGVTNTVDLIDESEMQLLMQREDSIKNQQVRSLAMQAATNRVLLAQIQNALREMKNVCHADRSPRFRRQYDVLYSRYIRGWAIEAICTELGIERTCYFQTLTEAMKTFSLILFGEIEPGGAVQNETEEWRSGQSEQLKFF